MDLKNKTVLVTGGNGNIGWGIAHAAEDAGAQIVLPTDSEEARVMLHGETRGALYRHDGEHGLVIDSGR